jgi:hypothetical protein
MAPLPTLPPGFFDLPPRQGNLSILEPDEFNFSIDQGPFQSKPSAYVMEQVGNKSKSLPRVTSTAGSKRSKWRSHYQMAQAHESEAFLEIPCLLVDTVAAGEEIETPSKRQDDPDLLTPGQREKDQSRIGTFGTILPLLNSKDLGGDRSDTSSRSMHSVDRSKYNRSSSSSYISGLTSGTSRTSYSSSTGTSNASPTKSEGPVPVSEATPHLDSIFGNLEATSSPSPVVQLAIDLQETLLLARRESRRRSNTVVTPRVEKTPMKLAWNRSTQNLQRKGQKKSTFDGLQDDQEVIDIKAPSAPKVPSPVKRKLGGVPVSKSKWSQITSPTPLPELPQAVLPSLPSTPVPPARPRTPHGAAGTVVKSTTMSSSYRLPIGTTSLNSLKAPPKVPSNTPSSAFNVSLQSRSYRAPAFAMNVPKIPPSTRTLHTSPSNKSLKSKKIEANIRIPSVNDEEGTSPVHRLQPSLDPIQPVSRSDLPGNGANPPLLPRSIPNPKNLRLNLNTDPSSEGSSDITPRAASPPSTPSTFGAPSTPRPWSSLPDTQRAFWIKSPTTDVIAIAEQEPISRTGRLGSDATNSGLSMCSSGEELGQATLCVAQRMTVRRTSSNTIMSGPISEDVSRL